MANLMEEQLIKAKSKIKTKQGEQAATKASLAAAESARAGQSKARAATFQRQLGEMPGMAAREAAASGAMAYGRQRGRGGAMLAGLRDVGITGQKARGQAALEATELSEKASKKTAGQKQMIMQEIENLRKAKRYDKASVEALSYLAEGDPELTEFINQQAASAPGQSQSTKDKNRNIGDDIKDGLNYLNPF